MAVRSDQLHSHQFSRRRVVAALAGRDPARPPSTGTAPALAGLMVAALALAAFGVFGLLRPADDGSWRDGGSVVVERESGARFVYRDGLLHPVLNYSSALLILGSSQPRSSLVARSSLAGVARGAPLGIPGAPDLLPAAGELLTDPWTVCSRPAGVGVESVLRLDSGPSDRGRNGSGIGDRALVVADPGGDLHVLWHRHRYAIRKPDLVLAAFAWPRESATPVAPAVLNAVPAGPDLAGLAVDGAGRRSAAIPGRRIGEVVVVENSGGGRQFAVVTARGLADVTPVQADLLLAGGDAEAGAANRMSQAEYATAPRAASMVPSGESAPPAEAPELATATGAVCAGFAAGGGPPEISAVAAESLRRDGELSAPAPAPPASAPVDWLHIPPGRGAVVEALAAPGAPNGALSLITDLGVRFPVPSRDVLAMLGYADVRPQRLPAAVVALMPTGRALDPAAAAQPVVPGR
jgi:type VII secretion protein EccB